MTTFPPYSSLQKEIQNGTKKTLVLPLDFHLRSGIIRLGNPMHHQSMSQNSDYSEDNLPPPATPTPLPLPLPHWEARYPAISHNSKPSISSTPNLFPSFQSNCVMHLNHWSGSELKTKAPTPLALQLPSISESTSQSYVDCTQSELRPSWLQWEIGGKGKQPVPDKTVPDISWAARPKAALLTPQRKQWGASRPCPKTQHPLATTRSFEHVTLLKEHSLPGQLPSCML